jgi:hypothetical protein
LNWGRICGLFAFSRELDERMAGRGGGKGRKGKKREIRYSLFIFII